MSWLVTIFLMDVSLGQIGGGGRALMDLEGSVAFRAFYVVLDLGVS